MQEQVPPPIEESLRRMAEIRDSAYAAAKQIGIEAVQHSVMTRIEVAGILEVHPHTVGRWVAASAAEVEAPSET
ncbi:MAG: hypothetical protein AB7O90_19480 [Hyphomicrobium sp.]